LEALYEELVWNKVDLIYWRNTNADKTPKPTELWYQHFLPFLWSP